MKINSINSETSIGHYKDVIGVNNYFLALLIRSKKNLITNGVVYPSFGARFKHISHSDWSPWNIELQMLDYKILSLPQIWYKSTNNIITTYKFS